VDVGGRRVKRLTSGPLLAGKHTVTWNGRDERGKPAAPGIYFVRVGLGNERAGSKIVLVR
jgi:flagellar hook assembly protein FlgD